MVRDACMLLLVLFLPLHSVRASSTPPCSRSLAAACAAACGGCAALRLRKREQWKVVLDGLKAKTAVFTITRCLLKQPTNCCLRPSQQVVECRGMRSGWCLGWVSAATCDQRLRARARLAINC